MADVRFNRLALTIPSVISSAPGSSLVTLSLLNLDSHQFLLWTVKLIPSQPVEECGLLRRGRFVIVPLEKRCTVLIKLFSFSHQGKGRAWPARLYISWLLFPVVPFPNLFWLYASAPYAELYIMCNIHIHNQLTRFVNLSSHLYIPCVPQREYLLCSLIP